MEIHQEEGYRFMGAVFEVYNELGYGMAEEIYQESLEIELGSRGIAFVAKPELRCRYKTRTLERRYFPDLLVADSLVVELKAVGELASEHEAQLFNYLRIIRWSVGYLVNFGHPDELQWKRFIL